MSQRHTHPCRHTQTESQRRTAVNAKRVTSKWCACRAATEVSYSSLSLSSIAMTLWGIVCIIAQMVLVCLWPILVFDWSWWFVPEYSIMESEFCKASVQIYACLCGIRSLNHPIDHQDVLKHMHWNAYVHIYHIWGWWNWFFIRKQD